MELRPVLHRYCTCGITIIQWVNGVFKNIEPERELCAKHTSKSQEITEAWRKAMAVFGAELEKAGVK